MVVTEVGSPPIAGYYAWRMSSVPPEDLPPRLLKGVGRYSQPFALLARIGVDLDHEGRGLGQAMIRDVLRRVVHVTEHIACRGLEIDAETEAVKAYYQHLIPQFEESPRNPLKLVLLISDIRRVLAAGQLD